MALAHLEYKRFDSADAANRLDKKMSPNSFRMLEHFGLQSKLRQIPKYPNRYDPANSQSNEGAERTEQEHDGQKEQDNRHVQNGSEQLRFKKLRT